MSTFYFVSPAGPAKVETTADSYDTPPGFAPATEAEYETALVAVLAALDASAAAQVAARQADAQAAYDEIVGIHPITALLFARQIHPEFTP